MNYIRPLRRKIGIVALVIACVLVVGWVRSFFIEDRIAFTISRVRHAISSYHGAIAWEHWIDDGHQGGVIGWSSDWRSEKSLIHSTTFFQSRPGSMLGKLEHESRSVRCWQIVIPLTLLSAWLLLSKPRAKPGPTQIYDRIEN